MNKPIFMDSKDAYKNGDVILTNRHNCECIYVDYNELTHSQIWGIFYYLKSKKCRLDNIKFNYKSPERRNSFNIKKVYFNPPVTVVIWEDGTKTIVRTQGKDKFDPEKGLAMAISKKALGNKGTYYDEFKKWSEPYQEELDRLDMVYTKLCESMSLNAYNASNTLDKIYDAIGKHLLQNKNAVDTEEPNYTEDGE